MEREVSGYVGERDGEESMNNETMNNRHSPLSFLGQMPLSVKWGAGCYILMRTLLWGWGVIVVRVLPLPPAPPLYLPVVADPGGVLGVLLSPWNRWDVLWYIRIALEGYTVADARGAYNPLWGMSIGVLGRTLDGQYLLAGFVLTDLCALIFLIMLFEFAQREGYDGRRTVAMFLLYPMTFFVFLPYAEAMLLMWIAATLLALQGQRWGWVALFGSLAVLTKVMALALLIPVAWEWWKHRHNYSRWSVLWMGAPLLVEIGWISLRSLLLGTSWIDLNSSFGAASLILSPSYQTGFGATERLSWPGESLWLAFTAPWRLFPHAYTLTAIVHIPILLWVFYLTWRSWKRTRVAYTLYAVALIMTDLFIVVQDVPLQDAPRRWMMSLPLFLIASQSVSPQWKKVFIVGSMVVQLLLSALYVKWNVVG